MDELERLAVESRQVNAVTNARLRMRARRKSGNGILIFAVIGAVALLAAFVLYFVSGVFDPVGSDRPAVTATVSAKGHDFIFQNGDSRPVEIEAAINDDFRQTVSLAPGEKRSLPITEFVDSKGMRFNLQTMKPLRLDMTVSTSDGGKWTDHRDIGQ